MLKKNLLVFPLLVALTANVINGQASKDMVDIWSAFGQLTGHQ
jgi:hypothetical protein